MTLLPPTGPNGPNGPNGDGSQAPPPDDGSDYVVGIRGVRALPTDVPGELELEIQTTRGELHGVIHPCEGRGGCVVFVGGAAGGVEGPANGVYAKLARDLVGMGVTSLRLRYREAGEFTECVLDTLAACSVLKGIGAERAVIVGHSFGGAVAIKAAELAPLATAVVGLSSQRFGTQDVERLGKSLLLIHGGADEVLLPQASQDIFERAQEPKRIVILDGNGHGLRESPDEVYELLREYIVGNVGDPLA